MKTYGLRIASVDGVPIYIDVTWLPACALIALVTATIVHSVPFAVLTTLVFYACLLAHEMSHVAVATHFRIKTTEIRLGLFGALAIMEEPNNPHQEWKIAAAGPLMSLLIALLWLGMLIKRALSDGMMNGMPVPNDPVLFMDGTLVGLNFLACAFNMLPFYPMDGGRIFRAVTQIWTGRRGFATRTAAVLTVAGAIAMAIWAGIGIHEHTGAPFLRLGFAVLLAGQAIAAARAESRLEASAQSEQDAEGRDRSP